MNEAQAKLKEYMEAKRVEREVEEQKIFNNRTAALPELLRPFHQPGPFGKAWDSSLIVLPDAAEIKVRWLSSHSTVVSDYVVADLRYTDWEDAVKFAEAMHHPTNDPGFVFMNLIENSGLSWLFYLLVGVGLSTISHLAIQSGGASVEFAASVNAACSLLFAGVFIAKKVTE